MRLFIILKTKLSQSTMKTKENMSFIVKKDQNNADQAGLVHLLLT